MSCIDALHTYEEISQVLDIERCIQPAILSAGAGSDTGSDAYVEMLRHQTGGSTCRQHAMGMPDAAANGRDQCASFDDQEAIIPFTEDAYDSAAVNAMSPGLHNQPDSYSRLAITGGVHKHRHKRKT